MILRKYLQSHSETKELQRWLVEIDNQAGENMRKFHLIPMAWQSPCSCCGGVMHVVLRIWLLTQTLSCLQLCLSMYLGSCHQEVGVSLEVLQTE